MVRKYNFNPGPSTLPLSVIEKIKAEMPDFRGAGMSVLEISHRSKEFIAVLENAKNTLREVMGIPEDYEIIFLGGGASLQFAMIPMNFLAAGQKADYVSTGTWSEKAIKEALKIGEVNTVASSKDKNFTYIPDTLNFSDEACYAHITSNNTIFGTQWHTYPDTKNVPLFVDMSSDIMSRKVDISKFAFIYAGAQKNMGPAGVTMVIARKDLLEKSNENIPNFLRYPTHANKDSCYNTPPVFQIYVVGLVAEWVKESGELAKIEEINRKKADLLYGTVDSYPEFFKGTAAKKNRSLMNATLRLPSEELEAKFIKEAAEQDFHGLKGHRSVGGIRVSMYNALPLEGIEKLSEFMKNFVKSNG